MILCAFVNLLLFVFLLSWYLDDQFMLSRHRIKLLYMVQTESCLSEYHQEVIGDPAVCPCDVLVLSYRTKCDKPPPPNSEKKMKNVEYIYTGEKWTSWSKGRNVLYREAMKRRQEYLYFIIMDDDIVLEREEAVWGSESIDSPWRRFEEFLVQIEPATAAIDTEDKLWLRRAARGRKNLGCKVDESAEYVSVARYDSIFNAFHNKTIRNILPYPLKFDRISWIFAPMCLSIKIELMYAGHSVLHSRIFATNQSRRLYYHKRWPNASSWNAIVDEAASRLPEKYRNCSLMQGWRRDGTRHEQKSPTICLPPPPPKMPIQEFAFVDGAATRIFVRLEYVIIYFILILLYCSQLI